MSAQTDVAIRGTRSAGGPGFRQRAGGLARSAALWVIAAILLLLAGIVTVLVGGGENTAPLHYESTGEDGGRAFVEVLRDHGRDVTTTERYPDAAGAVDAGGTVLVYADGYALTEEAAAGVVEAPPLTTTMEWRTVSGVRYHIITSYYYEARRDSRVVNSWTLVRRMVRQSTPPVIVDTDD